MKSLDSVLDTLFARYSALNPSVDRLYGLLRARGESVFNDHIAIRTFPHPEIGLDAIASSLQAKGLSVGDRYEFTAKKLDACYFRSSNPDHPKIFVSQIRVHELSPSSQGILSRLLSFDRRVDEPLLLGRPWNPSREDFKRLTGESEYAAWLCAHGVVANHFTVDVNRLTTFSSLEELNHWLEENEFALNTSGGKIKGGPEVRLAQSSTLADSVEVEFADGKLTVPGCYSEFAVRYPLESGDLYQGFVPASADRIFESTNQSSSPPSTQR